MTRTPSSIVVSNKVVRPVVRWMAITSLASTQAFAFTPFVRVPLSFERSQRVATGSRICKDVTVTVTGESLPGVNQRQHQHAHTCNLHKHTRLFLQSKSKGYYIESRLSSTVSDTFNYKCDAPYTVPLPSLLYSADVNDSRYSASDWFHNIMTLPKSSILNEIKGPVIAITIWSTFVSMVHLLLRQKNMAQAAKAMTISSKPHALLVSALGLLLVFRTNSAYQRFAVSAQFGRVKEMPLCRSDSSHCFKRDQQTAWITHRRMSTPFTGRAKNLGANPFDKSQHFSHGIPLLGRTRRRSSKARLSITISISLPPS
jgi:hypothetical protein